MSLKIHAIRQSEAEKAKDRNWSRGRIQHVREYDNNQNKVTQKFEQRLKNIERSLHAANDVMTGYPQPHPVPHPSFMPANVYPHQPTSAYSWQAPTRQPKHQKNRHCYVCNSGRHFSNQCPHREETTAKEVYGDAQENAEMDEPNIVRTSLVKGPTSAYIKAQIRGKTVSCLLDSGSESSILSEKFIRERDLRPSQRTLLAVNNSEVCVLGEATVKMNVGGICVSLPALVSTEVDGVVLGLDWMKRNRLSWRFQDSFVRLAGRRISLHFRPEPDRCRRVVVLCKVPPTSEQHARNEAICPSETSTNVLIHKSFTTGREDARSSLLADCVISADKGECIKSFPMVGKAAVITRSESIRGTLSNKMFLARETKLINRQREQRTVPSAKRKLLLAGKRNLGGNNIMLSLLYTLFWVTVFILRCRSETQLGMSDWSVSNMNTPAVVCLSQDEYFFESEAPTNSMQTDALAEFIDRSESCSSSVRPTTIPTLSAVSSLPACSPISPAPAEKDGPTVLPAPSKKRSRISSLASPEFPEWKLQMPGPIYLTMRHFIRREISPSHPQT